MPIIAQVAGQAITGAAFDALDVGFTGNPAPFSPNGNGFTYYFDADPQMQRSASDQDSVNRFLASPDGGGRRANDGSAALGYAALPTKAPPSDAAPVARDWLAWIDVRGTEYDRTNADSNLTGTQIDGIAGLTRRLTPDLLVGVLGGYENFDYSSQVLTGTLKGDAWTAGTYLGWRFAPHLRFDMVGAWSDVLARDSAGSAAGKFTGNRWLVSGGVTGTYGWQSFVLEPSARVYALWEHDNPYTDSLGTAQPANNFSTGRASAGVQATYPFVWSSIMNLAPYAGFYGDYYFSREDAGAIGIATVPLLEGFSARFTSGVTASFAGGARLTAGGEYGGIGSDNRIWTWRVRGSVPF